MSHERTSKELPKISFGLPKILELLLICTSSARCLLSRAYFYFYHKSKIHVFFIGKFSIKKKKKNFQLYILTSANSCFFLHIRRTCVVIESFCRLAIFLYCTINFSSTLYTTTLRVSVVYALVWATTHTGTLNNS